MALVHIPTSGPAPLYPLRSPAAAPRLRTPLWQLELGLDLIQAHFGNPERVALEDASFLWSDDDTQSRLFVGQRDNLNFETVGKRAAVVVGLGDQRYPQKMVGDLQGVTAMGARLQLHDLTEGTWQFECYSTKPNEALSLATETKYFFMGYRRPLQANFGFQKIRPSSLSAPAPAPDNVKIYRCVLGVDFVLEDNFELEQVGLPLAAFRFDLQAKPGGL